MSKTSNNPTDGTPSHDPQGSLVPVPSWNSLGRHARGGLHRGPGSQQGLTLQFVLTAIRQWWKIAAPIGLLLAAISGSLVYVLFEPVYEATAWLRIEDKRPYVAFPDSGTSKTFIDTQVELIRSPLVLGPVLVREDEDGAIASIPEIQEEEDPLQWLKGRLEVKQVGQSELFNISYAGPDAKNSARLVNAVVTEYFNLRGKTEAERTQRVIELLDAESQRRAEEVNRLRENVRELAKQATGKDPYAANSETELVVRPALADLQTRLTNAEVERRIMEARIKALEERSSKGQAELPEALVARAVEENREVQAQKARLSAKRAALRARLDEIKLKLVRPQPEKDEFCRRLEKEIKLDEDTLAGLKEELGEQVRAELKTSLAGRQEEELAGLKAQLASYTLMEQLLQERYDEQRKGVEQGSGETLQLTFAKADLERAEQVFELIAQRVLTLRTEQRAPARVTQQLKAKAPKAPLAFPYAKITLGMLASFFLPFGLAILWERMARRVTNIQQLEEDSNLAVVGEVARLPVRTTVLSASSSRRVGRDLGIFEESIDTLRTCLVLSEPLKDMKVLAVTSSANHEGKTSVAVQLAVSIARASGEPTLLIDGDMRSPDIHNVLGGPLEPGLGDVLAKQCSLKDAIVTDCNEAVHMLPAGKLHSSPHKLLGNGVLGALFDEIRESYRYIVMDTPPVLAAGEALVLARAADAALLCAMRDVSRIDQIKKTHHRLLTAGARPVGIVLNGIPAKRYTYRYGSYAYSQE